MILESITLRNSCLFRGEQAVNLTPLPAARNAGTRPIGTFRPRQGDRSVQFHPVLPIMADVADARVKTAAEARAVVAIRQEW